MECLYRQVVAWILEFLCESTIPHSLCAILSNSIQDPENDLLFVGQDELLTPKNLILDCLTFRQRGLEKKNKEWNPTVLNIFQHLHFNFPRLDTPLIYREESTIRNYIFFTGKDASKSFTDEEGTTVCWAGLCIALASFASICEQYQSQTEQLGTNFNILWEIMMLTTVSYATMVQWNSAYKTILDN